MKNYVYAAETVTVVAGGTVTSGDLDVISEIMGVATHDAVSGESVTYAVRGAFTLPKVAGVAWAVGDLIDFDSSAAACTTGLTPAAGDIVSIGFCTATAASGATTGEVCLVPATGTKS